MRSSAKIDPKNRPEGNPSKAPTHKRSERCRPRDCEVTNQFQLTEPNLFTDSRRTTLRDDVTIADVLSSLFAHVDEDDFLPGVIRGTIEEIELLSGLLIDESGSDPAIGGMLSRLGSRLELCFAVAKRMREGAGNEESDDRVSGEFRTAKVAS